MQIYVTDTDKGGSRQTKYLTSGATVRNYFEIEKPGCELRNYTVMVNRSPADAGRSLSEGDSVVISAAKPVGAKPKA